MLKRIVLALKLGMHRVLEVRSRRKIMELMSSGLLISA